MRSKKPTQNTDKLFVVAADDWLNDVLAMSKYGSYTVSKSIVRNLNQTFGYKKIKEITKRDIQRYVLKLHETLAPSSIRHNLSVFKGIMEYASEDWVMPTRIKIPRKVEPRQEHYTFDEVRKLLIYAKGQLRVLILLLAETGMRVGEALALQTEDIHGDSIDIHKNIYCGVIQSSPKTDSGKRKVCITNRLQEELKYITRKDPKEFIFRSSSNRPPRTQILAEELTKLCARVDLPWKGFHAFRRGNVTELILNGGVPEKVVGYRIGHKSQSITLGIYCRVQAGDDKPWMEKIGELLWTSEV